MFSTVFLLAVFGVCIEAWSPKGSVTTIAVWSRWSEYSICTASCGGGLQLARRECLLVQRANKNPLLNSAGVVQTCTGSDIDIRLCNTAACVVQGGWTQWSVVSACCGGRVVRHRSCTAPVPVNSPECAGAAVDVRTCTAKETEQCGCPVSCGGEPTAAPKVKASAPVAPSGDKNGTLVAVAVLDDTPSKVAELLKPGDDAEGSGDEDTKEGSKLKPGSGKAANSFDLLGDFSLYYL